MKSPPTTQPTPKKSFKAHWFLLGVFIGIFSIMLAQKIFKRLYEWPIFGQTAARWAAFGMLMRIPLAVLFVAVITSH